MLYPLSYEGNVVILPVQWVGWCFIAVGSIVAAILSKISLQLARGASFDCKKSCELN
jgi:hypothetical protein